MPPLQASPSPDSWPDPAPPSKLTLEEALRSARETRFLRIAPDLLGEAPAVFRQQFPGRQAVIVTDAVVFKVAGENVQASFVRAGVPHQPPFVFSDPGLYAEHGFVTRLEESLRRHDAIPVAVGSGTINDLVKLAAHRVGRPYLCLATAASMDGYTAFGASITFRGAKQTFFCPAPQAVLADTAVIARAPSAMTAAGYADLLAKITAGADWIVADALGQESIDPRAWAIVQGGLKDALARPAEARAGQAEAISALTEGLMLGGFAMQWTRSSRPASGAEHQFSHLWDMEHHAHEGRAPSHGFKVGLATLAVTSFYEELLRQPLERLDVARCCAAWPTPAEAEAGVRRLFAGEDFVETAVEETRAKHCSREELRAGLERLVRIWPALRPRLAAQLVPLAELRRRLAQVGAPTRPEEIGLTAERLRHSFRRAYHIRRRFTVLDLAVRAGCLDTCLAGIFRPGGAWSQTR
jgi:glycerol-1-phosphate dehydrogenase [NAD(P)+]